ncbi:Asp-tRNA(Asn)/Glu-tRNA(Gln) amidotransferase subunit GatB [Candidatus Pacearchaeota archaeon]|nr:Asp-tRNA(Asn)/Glu-tRNA(Gln) amidotransferase subunit GatB [Candidatus Pacearchaeota archaeon]
MKNQPQPMIGLEIHGYIETIEKLFCNCYNYHDMKVIKPNTNICPICTGQPGAKPMLPNESAVKKTIEIGIMLNCKPNLIENNKPLVFQRKHYNWPDMPTSFQKTISGAYSIPVVECGNFLDIRITEAHLEEDPAAWNPETGKIDYNRAGAPLIEIVTEPDFTSSKQAETWLRQLVLTLSYIKAINKDAGIKADVNVSLKGQTVRTEIKNVNSITQIVKAIDSEIKRHIKDKPKIEETRRWNSVTQKTELMRVKHTAADYRFIPEPDLPALKINKNLITEIKKSIPETPQEKLEKLIKKLKINQKDATVLTKNLEIVELFEEVSKKIPPQIALPWIAVEWLSVLNYNNLTSDQVDINPDHIIELLNALNQKKITQLKAKDILRKFIPKSFSPKKEIESSSTINSDDEIRKITKEIIKNNQKSVEDFKSGEKKAFNFLVGQVMQKTNRRADFQTAKKILEEEI